MTAPQTVVPDHLQVSGPSQDLLNHRLWCTAQKPVLQCHHTIAVVLKQCCIIQTCEALEARCGHVPHRLDAIADNLIPFPPFRVGWARGLEGPMAVCLMDPLCGLQSVCRFFGF